MIKGRLRGPERWTERGGRDKGGTRECERFTVRERERGRGKGEVQNQMY